MANDTRYAPGSNTSCRDSDGAGERRFAAVDGSGAVPATLLDYSVIKAEKWNKDLYVFKRVISGEVIEDYIYERVQGGEKKGNEKGRMPLYYVENESESIDALIKSGNKAKREIRRIVNANVGRWGKERAKFFTITFEENIQDQGAANYKYKKCIQKLNYYVYGEKCNKLKYLVVLQFQDRGAIHWHVIFFNLPYIPVDKLAKIWGEGFVKINAIDNVDNAGAYVASYVGNEKGNPLKGNGGRFVDVRYYNHKRYFRSKGLYESEIIRSIRPLPVIEGEPVFQAEFENEHTGKVKYSQYNPNKRKSKGRKDEGSM